jgi:hypothetical protein
LKRPVNGGLNEVAPRAGIADAAEQEDARAVGGDQRRLQVRIVRVIDAELDGDRLDDKVRRHVERRQDLLIGRNRDRHGRRVERDRRRLRARRAAAAEYIEAGVQVRVEPLAGGAADVGTEDQRVRTAQLLGREADAEGAVGQCSRRSGRVGRHGKPRRGDQRPGVELAGDAGRVVADNQLPRSLDVLTGKSG